MVNYAKLSKPKIKELNIKSKNGKKIVQASFSGAKFKREDIQYLCKKLGDELGAKISGRMHVSLQYDTHWRSGGWSKLGEPVKLWSEKDYNREDQPTYSRFVVYVQKDGVQAGGESTENSCFFDCLKKLIPNDALPWKTDYDLKHFLKINANEMMPISAMDSIQEELPKYKLLITGDYVYTSSVKSHKELRIRLVDSHYSVIKPPKQVYAISDTPKIMLIYQKSAKDYIVMTNEHPKRWIMSEKDFQQHWKKPITSPYVMIPFDDSFTTFKSYYDHLTTKADIYKKETNGKIDFYKTGTDSKTILDLFYKFTQNITADVIEQDEAVWVSEATQGSLIYSEYYKGEGFQYDMVSMYPSIQKDQKMLFPIKRGDFEYISPEDFESKTFFQYGIYKCCISYDKTKAKQFRWNDNNTYTHFDLNNAKKLGLTITINDIKPNALIYTRDKLITGKNLFGEYINYVFPFKQNKLPDSKKLLNSLWGLLCQKDEIKMNLKKGETIELYDNKEITEIQPKHIDNTEDIRIKIVNNAKIYKSSYGRIGAFLLSRARLIMSILINDYADQIVRIHTDGFISKTELNIKTGSDIGDMKYEGMYSVVEVKNSMKVLGQIIN